MRKKNKLIFNHLRLKLLYKNINEQELHNEKIVFSLYIYDLWTFKQKKIYYNLLLLEKMSSLKAYIKSYKKSYQKLDIYLQSIARKKYMDYFLRMMKLFYAPMLKRGSDFIIISFDQFNNIFFGLENLNYFPILSETYTRNNNPLYISLYIKSISQSHSLLVLNYYSGLK